MPSNSSDFPLHISEEDGRTVARFPASTMLSEANAEELFRTLLALTEGKENPHLLVDLGGVTMLTSIVLSKFIALNGRVRALSGRLTLFNPNKTVHQVFKVTRLDTVLELCEKADAIPA